MLGLLVACVIAVVLILLVLAAGRHMRAKSGFFGRRRAARRPGRAAQLWAASSGGRDAAVREAVRLATAALALPAPRDAAGLERRVENHRVLAEIERVLPGAAPPGQDEEFVNDVERLLAAHEAAPDADPDWLLAVLPAIGGDLRQLQALPLYMDAPVDTRRLQERTATDRRRAAEAATDVPGLRAATQLRLAREQASDSQNAHDTAVSAACRAAVARLRADPAGPASIDSIERYFRDHAAKLTRDPHTGQSRPGLLRRALSVVAGVQNKATHVSAVNATDSEVLGLVWRRADHPLNAETRDQIRQALFDAVVDAHTPYGSVCANGRVTRFIGALDTLDRVDHQPIARVEDIRSSMLDAGQRAATAAARQLRADPRLGAAARGFLATTAAELQAAGDATPEEEKDLQQRLTDAAIAAADETGRKFNDDAPGSVSRAMQDEVNLELRMALTP